MSMVGNFRRLGETDLQRLLKAPDLIAGYLYEKPPEEFGPFTDLDIDKAWHGIHYLLTGSACEGDFPLGFIVQGGAVIGEVDVGYGPARGFSAKEVGAIAKALAGLDADAMRARFNPQAMMAAEVYPRIWDRPPAEDDTLGYLTEYYKQLRDFIAGAAVGAE